MRHRAASRLCHFLHDPSHPGRRRQQQMADELCGAVGSAQSALAARHTIPASRDRPRVSRAARDKGPPSRRPDRFPALVSRDQRVSPAPEARRARQTGRLALAYGLWPHFCPPPADWGIRGQSQRISESRSAANPVLQSSESRSAIPCSDPVQRSRSAQPPTHGAGLQATTFRPAPPPGPDHPSRPGMIHADAERLRTRSARCNQSQRPGIGDSDDSDL